MSKVKHVGVTFSRKEIEEAARSGSYGTITQRLSKDSLFKFGTCHLTMTTFEIGEDVVATPSGHLYRKESILNYLLESTNRLKKEYKEWEKSQKNITETAASSMKVTLDDGSILHNPTKKKQKTFEIDDRTKEEKHNILAKSAFWLPTANDLVQVEKSEIPKPDKTPKSPNSGKPLKMSQLITVHLEQANPPVHGEYICSVTKKPITIQALTLIAPSGYIMTNDAYNEVAKKTKICPITSIPFDPETQAISLIGSGTSFSSHNNVISQSWKPGM